MKVRLAAFAIAGFMATAANADTWGMVEDESSFQPIRDRDQFVQIVSQGTLSRFGIKLTVEPDGRIDGRAFGAKVRGAWNWQDGFFCRDLYWGQRDLGANCQEVKVSGDTLRFTSDQGTGQYADLRLQ